MKQNSPKIRRLLAAAFLVLLLPLAGCARSDAASQDGAPPKTLWHLGGAPILADFSTSGGTVEPTGVQTDIVIYVPMNLVKDGFYAYITGTTPDGEQEDLAHNDALTPGSYYVISSDTWQKYDSLILHVGYSWQGELMSMRVIDLFTHEDLVPVYPTSQP